MEVKLILKIITSKGNTKEKVTSDTCLYSFQ